MLELLRTIFTPGNFEPHIVHFIPNNMGLVWFMVAGNALIALSYTLIPLALLYFLRKRKDIVFTHIFWLFAAFIVLCGLTHVMHIMIFWYPAYWLEAIVLALTGVISIFTFFALVKILPLALKLKSPKELDIINQQLKAANQQLAASENKLQNKILELEKFNKLTVDRELKMVELKEKIARLEKNES